MEYTIQELANLAGISTRTLRYYDEIQLLSPSYKNKSGYRIYTKHEVDLLQQILFYKELGMELNQIKNAVTSPAFNRLEALKEHSIKLLDQKHQLELLIENVNQSILEEEGKITMNDKEKFEGLKHKLVQENEYQYGKEIRKQYGDKTVEESNEKMLNLSKEDYEKMQETEHLLLNLLEQAVKEHVSASSDLGKKIANLHKQWLLYTWPSYSKEAHLGLVEMYLADERFQSYYDKHLTGCTDFLKAAVEQNI